ncbi:MAG TPA: hypothetical protein VLF62_03015 [Candidatus Saccharimonadales bacterium]|nr:hypothetical protein [Candidatus Saccharimonadales bacterium]
MTNPEMPGHFMTPRFAEHARAVGAVAINTQPDELAGMSEYLKGEAGFGLPAAPNRLDFAYFWTAGGQRPNPHYYEAKPDDPFVPGEALAYPTPYTVSKNTISGRWRTVVELQSRDLSRPNPLSFAAARAMLSQTPEQVGLTSDSAAWMDFAARKGNASGVVDAVINGFAPERFTRVHRLAEEAARRFSHAITLQIDQG